MVKLSVVLATYNESQEIEACLRSVQGWADEMIVVDGTSQDGTAELAKKCGAQVYIVPNNEMFHKNKQKAVDYAQGEWVLQLDADERVSKKLKEEIDQAMDLGEEDGYFIPRKNWFLGRFLMKGGVYPDAVIRLFKHGKGHFPCKSVHEQIKIAGSVGWLKQDLIHNADPTLEKYLLRLNRYSSLEAGHLYQQGVKPSLVRFIEFMLWRPIYWFGMRYFRHKGFMDGFQGFLFALFSALHWPIMYLKIWEKSLTGKNT